MVSEPVCHNASPDASKRDLFGGIPVTGLSGSSKSRSLGLHSRIVSASNFVSMSVVGRGVVARVLTPKITEREADIVSSEIGEAAQASGWRVAVDMTEVGFLASAGIGALVNLHQQAKQSGGKMVVFGLNDQLAQVLKISRLDKLFPIKPDLDSASKLIK